MAKNDFLLKLNGLMKLRNTWRKMAEVEAVNFSKERFVRKNWVDSKRQPWDAWSKSYAESDRHGASLLIGKKSGRLKRSIRKLRGTATTVVIGTDVPYAEIHNEGGTINKSTRVRAHRRTRKGKTTYVQAHSRKMNLTMPQRRFIGESALLSRRMERKLQKEMNKILK